MIIMYALYEDTDGTMRSGQEFIGRVVATEEEAKQWVDDGRGKGYLGSDIPRSYRPVETPQESADVVA